MKSHEGWLWDAPVTRICVLACVVVTATVGVCLAEESPTLEQLNAMEQRADMARQHYRRGSYADAIQIFSELTMGTHPSVNLYKNELGMCYLASGDNNSAERCFVDVATGVDRYVDQRLEREALSKFGKEEAKIYRGDPYEQATSFMLLALLFLNRGDVDNALAACKSGLLADSDATENRYDSDYALLHLIEGKCHMIRGSLDEFHSRRDLAVHSIKITSPGIRAMVSERRDVAELMNMSSAQRKKVQCTASDSDLKARLDTIDQTLAKEMSAINTDQSMGTLYSGTFNTLVIAPVGVSPIKVRKGKDGQMVAFESISVRAPAVDLTLNGTPLRDRPLGYLADIEFQATTRNGRRMDAILNGKAAFRSTTVGVGDSILQAGNNVGGGAGLAIALVGAAVQGVGGAMTPEADTRCWKTLPRQFDVYAMELPQGPHSISCQTRIYFEKSQVVTRDFNIKSPDDVAVVFLPPGLVGLYSEQTHEEMKLAARDTFGETEAVQVVIPPIMGLERVMRFRDEKNPGRADAVATDLRKAMRNVRSILGTQELTSCLVTHEDVVSHYDALAHKAPMAIQILVGDAHKKATGKEAVYHLEVSLSLIDTRRGSVLCRQDLTGECQASKAGAGTAFYDCLDAAVRQFVGSRDFTVHVHTGGQMASKQ